MQILRRSLNGEVSRQAVPNEELSVGTRRSVQRVEDQEMSKDTTPVVGDVWETEDYYGIPDTKRIIQTGSIVLCRNKVPAYAFTGLYASFSLDQWHAWAASARRV